MPRHPDGAEALATGVDCLYADADMLVLNKPAGLLCVPGRGPDKQDCLSARAQHHWPGALVVHRLDMATSGLVLMARTLAAQRTLSQAFAERRVHKRYQAVVHGCLQPNLGPPGPVQPAQPPTATATATAGDWNWIDLPIAADWERRPLRVIDAILGKPSLTRWRVLRGAAALPGGPSTRVELEPVTGRTHQLRVHLAALGHPICGDALYADAPALARAPRLLLHATHLAFAHPSSGAPLVFDAAVPF